MKKLNWGNYKVICFTVGKLKVVADGVRCNNWIFESAYPYMIEEFGCGEGMKASTCEKRMREVRMNFRIEEGVANDLVHNRKEQTWTFPVSFLEYLEKKKAEWEKSPVTKRDIKRIIKK